MSWQKKLAYIFLAFPGQFKTLPKVFRSYFFIQFSLTETFAEALFSQFYKMITIKTVAVTKVPTSALTIYFQTLQIFITIKSQEKKLSMITIFKFLVSDHLNLIDSCHKKTMN